MVAPFERGLGHGGSQRASALAERLEERGAEVEWLTTPPLETGRLAKLGDALALRPGLVGLHPVPRALPVVRPAVAISAHSYLAPQRGALADPVVRVIDFHNLEWRHLEDALAHAPPARRAYLRLQVALMRRFERRLLAGSDLCAFASEDELQWARGAAPAAELAFAPSVLPQADAEEALATAPAGPAGRGLVYVGTLRFPPNLAALLEFLRTAWPAIREAVPGARLTVAGDCDPDARRTIDGFAGVDAIGFADDLRALLEPATAAIMPVEGRAGTSLRALHCALAGVWVIGSPAAFRGLPWEMGATVRTPAEWAEAVCEAGHLDERAQRRTAAARDAALALQRDPAPWDALYQRIERLSHEARPR